MLSFAPSVAEEAAGARSHLDSGTTFLRGVKMIKFEMGPNLQPILQNLKPYNFDKEKKFFVSDLARNLNPGTLKRFLAKKFFEIFFGPSENFFFDPEKSSQRFSIFWGWEVEIPKWHKKNFFVRNDDTHHWSKHFLH